jgi:2-polyprenyl-6-methoxyphenol hydroxylase-like FAD-dependent oxidoreductase
MGFDVCVRGGGVVGMALALQLASLRLRVALVARDQPRPGDVRAYALNSASRALLTALRVWPQPAHATPVQRMQVWGDDGGALAFDSAQMGSEALAWIVDVPALEQQLAQAVSYQSLIERLDAQGTVSAALTVVCEGRASHTRDLLGARFTAQPYGQHAIAARLSCELPHAHTARQWFAGGEILALLPLEGNSVALVWSVPDDQHTALMQLPAEEFQQRLQQATHGALGALALSSERAAWPLSLGRAERWVGPGWALAGDAAHSIHPLAGQGLNVGLADVAALSHVLQARQGKDYWRDLGDVRLLRRYERARKADVAAMGGLTDGLHHLFSQGDRRWQLLRNQGMKAFERSGPLKQWAARQAMGL